MARRRGLSDDDLKLWRLVAREIEPSRSTEKRLKAEARRAAGAAKAAEAAAQANRTAAAPSKKPQPAKPAPPRSPAPAAAPPAPPERPAAPARGRLAGVDRRTAERLRRGQYPIDARLDLHGMTQAQAHQTLTLFVRQCHAAGKRCLLVITGKGGRVRQSADGPFVNPEPPGILKRRVPEWLKQTDLAPLVLATAAATPGHGGHGALYVLLRRRREP